MPFKRPAVSIDEYQAVYDAIVERLKENGCEPEVIRLDPVFRSGVQSAYIPCTNRAHLDHAYFAAYGMKPGEFEQYAIEPTWYGLTRAPNERPATKIRGMKEGRHHPFFELGIKVRSAGFSPSEIEHRLVDVAGKDNKMQGKARDVMKSLKGSG